MSHSYVSNLVHCVFSTKERRPLLKAEFQERVWKFIGGIARTNGYKAIKVGGIPDHIHILLSLPATTEIAKAMQVIKSGSSKMIRETFDPRFEWQEGYGAFTIGISQVGETISYIEHQAEHHKHVGFAEEFAAFLRRHGIKVEDLPTAAPRD